MRLRRRRPKRGSAKPLVPLTTRVPRSLWKRVRLICVERGWKMQDFVAEAIRESLQRGQCG